MIRQSAWNWTSLRTTADAWVRPHGMFGETRTVVAIKMVAMDNSTLMTDVSSTCEQSLVRMALSPSTKTAKSFKSTVALQTTRKIRSNRTWRAQGQRSHQHSGQDGCRMMGHVGGMMMPMVPHSLYQTSWCMHQRASNTDQHRQHAVSHLRPLHQLQLHRHQHRRHHLPVNAHCSLDLIVGVTRTAW
jgi:hypothetical protein